jgi:hypothetical protein
MTVNDPTGNVWLTSKARMEAEGRFRRYDTYSHLLLAWYSLCLLFLAIFESSLHPNFVFLKNNELLIFLSVFILVISIFAMSQKYGEVAMKFRDCYLELDDILKTKNPQEIKFLYPSILKKYPNHSSLDYRKVLFQRITLNGQKLKDEFGDIKFHKFEIFLYLLTVAYRRIFFILIFSLPLIAGALLYA